MSNIIGNHVAGSRLSQTGGSLQDVFNPSTGDVSGQIRLSSAAELDDVVKVASEAALGWGVTPPMKRAQVMFRFKRLLEENADKIASAISSEHGKTHQDALGEVSRGLEAVEFSCGIPHLLKGTFSEQAAASIDVYSIPQALGVVAGITPFNFPAMVPLWMIPNALACGNSFILKPSERDPSVTLILADLLKEAGLPDGVFNVVQGDKVVVDAILDNPDIMAVSFVGSTPVAEYIYTRGAANGKRVQALGGAKNHMIIMPDADMGQVVDALMGAGYGSAGERCMAISVVVAVGEIADPLVEAIKLRMEKLVIGPGTDPASEMGPLITREARDRVAGYVQAGADAGCEVVVDGRDQVFDNDGFFLGVTLLDRVTTDMSVYTDEIFGPVLGVVRADSYADGVQMIRDNPFGNGAAIFTRDGGAARQFQRDADAGMVGINVPIPVPVGYHSFGGWNDSAFGDTTMYGPEGLRFYTRPKVITSRWPDPSTSSVDLGFPRDD